MSNQSPNQPQAPKTTDAERPVQPVTQPQQPAQLPIDTTPKK